MEFNTIAPVERYRHPSLASDSNIYANDFNITAQQLQLHPESPAPPFEVPAQHFQVITSLIDSFSILAATVPESEQDPLIEHQIHESLQPSRRQVPLTPPDADEVDRDLHHPPAADDSSEGEVAAAPVIRYARRPPVLSKRRSKSRFYSVNMSHSALATRDSIQSLRSRTESDGVGILGVERRHGSSASSTFSIISGLSAPLRKPTTESMRDKALSPPIPPKRLSSDRRRKTESLYSTDQEKEYKYPTRTSSIDGRVPSSPQLEQATVDSPTGTPLSRLSRGDLGNHMIPSRRSSLRRSVTGLSDTSQESSRYSVAGRNLKDLNIDSELIEGDNSTVRRIRELQEAREKRQKEWRNEGRKSERASKRHTISTPKVSQRSSPYASSRLSMTEVVVESPEVESPLELSAFVTVADLARMPALVPDVSEVESQGRPADITAHPSDMASATPSRGNSIGQSPATQPRRKNPLYSSRQEPSLAEIQSISDEVDTFLSAPRLTQKIRHPRTGRTVAFSEVGDPQGFVVLCCVGMGLTRYLTAFYDELARTLRLRLITPDRPGVGGSSSAPEAACTPLNWVDDVAVICTSLGITRFSLLAHSAGAIYALATALKMPQYVRGRIHLLAPWIPPSQMPKGASLGPDSQPIANLPLSHKILSVLPPTILKVANSRFLTATSASVDAKPLKSVRRNKQLQGLEVSLAYPFGDMHADSPFSRPSSDIHYERPQSATQNRRRSVPSYQENGESPAVQATAAEPSSPGSHRQTQVQSSRPAASRLTSEARRAVYNQTLTHRIWALATQNANPAIDLVVCLERRKPIGFRYPEVTRSVVIHHGARDSRVPLDNVRWLQSAMKRCELRVLDGEGHGLMASASTMATVLGEIAKEWEEWEKIAMDKGKRRKDDAPPKSTGSRS
ncbi:hypothetical protein A1O3_05736 [Capronia epimyces CBS 606.96]|uniref:AB hydrolase-1 domain-containing protein n=1 Tax=Capronia epimyces CBS 606.96 TaxID=1182542 RepID=W9Y742_9EURO|nr:uncharacterized protein A1O3_05736 [Capronia epimyces CBS 606.96]EXJ85061.1 hypothetical protein A1O3_05736 [Capronia epimyces CBS 606.96]